MRTAHSLSLIAAGALLACSCNLSAQSAAIPQVTPPQPAPVQDARCHMLATDWANLQRYSAADQALPPIAPGEQRVIFYGDSITDAWHLDQYFPGKGYINRGISGQTTPQMVVRFRQDVIDLKPRVLVVLAGTNDLSGNTGPMTIEQTEENYATMAELAKLHNITLVFSSVMPVNNYIHPEMTTGRPPEKILALNAWLKSYTQANHLIYLDYYTAMVDPSGMLQRPISNDGLHPNAAGYALIAPLAQNAVTAALAQTASPSTAP